MLLGTAVLAAAAGQVWGTDGTWITDGNGAWSDAGNWSSNPSIPNGIDQTATLGPASALRTITLDTPVTLGSLIFDSGPGYSVVRSSSGALTFQVSSGAAGITVDPTQGTGANLLNVPITLSSPVTIANDNGPVVAGGTLFPRALTISGPLSGSGNITIAGSGEVIFSGSNLPWSGALEITSGTLTAAASSSLGATSAGVLVDVGGVLAIQNGVNLNKPITLAGGTLAGKASSLSPQSYSGTLTVTQDSTLAAIGTGTVQGGLSLGGAINGAGNLTVASGNFTFAGIDGLTGRLIIAGGSLTIGFSASALNVSRVDVSAGVLTLWRPAGSSTSANSLAAHSVRLTGGMLAFNADIDPAAFLEAGSTGGQLAINISSFTAGGANLLDFSSMPGGAGLQLGTTTGGTLNAGLVLKADNQSHVLHLGIANNAALLTVAATLSDSNGVTGVDIAPGSNVELDAANSYSGPTTVSGTLTLGNASALGAGSGTDADGTTVYAGGYLTTLANVTLANEKITAAGGTLNLVTQGPVTVSADSLLQGTYNGAIDGSGAITVAGATTFGGNNTFTGGLTVGPAANLTVASPAALGNSPGPVNVNGGTLTLNTGDPGTVLSGRVTLTNGQLSGMATLTQALIYSGNVLVGGGSSQLTLPGISGSGVLSVGGALRGTPTSGNVVVTGDVTVQGDLVDIGGSFAFEGNTQVSGNTTLGAGTTWFTGSAQFGGAFSTNSDNSGGVTNGTFNGPVTVQSQSFEFDGATLFRGDVALGQAGQTITLQGPTTFDNTLNVANTRVVINGNTTAAGVIMSSGTLVTGAGATLTSSAPMDINGGTVQGTLVGPGIVKSGFDALTLFDIGAQSTIPISINQGTVVADVYAAVPGAAPLGAAGNVVTVASTDAVLALLNGASPPPVAGTIHLDNATGFLFRGAIIRTGPTGNFVLSGDIDLGSNRSILGAAFDNSESDPMALELDGVISGGGLITNGIVSLTNPNNTYTGPTVVSMPPVRPLDSGGTITYGYLMDGGNTNDAALTLMNGGRIVTSSSITVERGAMLKIDDRGTNMTNDAVADTIPITLDGGILSEWNAAANPGAEVLGNVRAALGDSKIALYGDSMGQFGSITLQSLTRDPGATVTFNTITAAPYGNSTTGRVYITATPTLTNGIIGGWAVAGTRDVPLFATYGPDGVVPISTYQTQLTTAAPTDNVVLLSSGGTRTLSADLPINSLTLDTFVTTTIDLQGHTLTLSSGGYLAEGTDPAIITNGTFTAGTPGTGGELFVHTLREQAQISANITDNAGGQVSLVKSGDFGLELSGANTYTGPTYANEGTLLIDTVTALPANNVLKVNGATVNFTLADPSATFQLGALELRQNGLVYGVVGGAAVNAASYTLESGTLHLRLTGNGPMQKNTEGTVFLAAQTSEYSGTIDVNAGTLAAWATSDPLGTGLVRVHAGANLVSNVLTLNNPIELAGDLSTSPPLENVPMNFNGAITATGPATITTVDTMGYAQTSPSPYYYQTLAFNNAVTVQNGASLTVLGAGTVQFNGGVTNHGTMSLTGATTIKGVLVNTGVLHITGGTAQVAAGMTLDNTGTVAVDAGKLVLSSGDGGAGGSLTVGTAGTVEFATSYDFSQPGEEVLSGDGMLLIDAGATVTLPVDVDFTGTVEVNGILQLALPRDGGSGADVMPRFSVVTGEASAVPEAGTMALLGAGALALLRRRRSVKRWGSGR